MTIAEIKNQLSIGQVLSHYNLKVNHNGMLNCPFHDDAKASMKVYAETNTVYCFSGSCVVKNLDVIGFIMKMDRSSKHEAILKAKSLCGQIISPNLFNQTFPKMSSSNASRDFKRYHKSIHNHKPAQEYCEDRCIDWRVLEIGYKSRRTTDRWGRGCIIFPLLDKDGQIVSLYGRGIEGSSHYYQSDRQGLYPGYPLRSSQVLILCESVIDVATLSGLDLPLANYSLLAMYGVNGLLDEHLRAITQMGNLEEIIFALDGDSSGKDATDYYARMLGRLHKGIKLSRLVIPDGEDVNSLAVGHEHYGGLFDQLFNERVLLDGEYVVELKEEALKVECGLNVSESDNLVYVTQVARYYIKGGVRSSSKDLQHLKVTLVVENDKGKKSRNGVDLYEDRQIEKVSRHVGDRLGLRADLVELDLHALADELEVYRKAQMQDTLSGQKIVKLSEDRVGECVQFWQQKSLFQKIDKQLELSGIIGEDNNRRLGFCIASSSRMLEPLHGLIQGSSGSGKTHLLTALCSLIPSEWYIPITRATDNSFYNFQTYELKNKLISIEDKDAMSDEANLAFRELQSKGMVSQSTTGQDEHGQNRSYVRQVYGPIASLACTTKGELYLDDMNRCFLLAVDESDEQTQRILLYQKRKAAGEVDGEKKEEVMKFMQDALRLLKPYEVLIPHATKISLPEGVKDKRRLNSLYLSLVKQITLLHQYQRRKDQSNRLIATIADLKLANEILFDAVVLKVDDLHGPLRSFYERLKGYLQKVAGEQSEKYIFRQREIRQELRLSRTGVYTYLKELLEMEYIQVVGGSDRRGYDYKVSYWDDNERLRKRIQSYLNTQLEKLK